MALYTLFFRGDAIR